MFPLLEDAELRLADPIRLHSKATPLQHFSSPQFKRLYLRGASLLFISSSSPYLPYVKLTVLALELCSASMENVGLLFQEVPQIEALQLMRVYALDPRRVASTIVAPSLRRFCVVPQLRHAVAHTPYTECWGMKLIRALEAPQLKELVYGVVQPLAGGVHITCGGENWAAKFPNLDVIGLWGVWLVDEDLREMLRLTSTGVQTFKFWKRANGAIYVENFVKVLIELAERGELMRLEAVDLYEVDIRMLYKGLKGGKKRLPLQMRIDRDGLIVEDDVDDFVARVKEVVELEVCNHSRFRDWMY
ncbi:hypothetical protein FRB99_003399 [Tulasnella sp. 403]|nr:hypothetical protein FRB99_003399 [Tulasnella sp. 403]